MIDAINNLISSQVVTVMAFKRDRREQHLSQVVTNAINFGTSQGLAICGLHPTACMN